MQETLISPFTGFRISVKKVQDLGFDYSWEGGFAEMGHRVWDIDMKRK